METKSTKNWWENNETKLEEIVDLNKVHNNLMMSRSRRNMQCCIRRAVVRFLRRINTLS